MKKKKYIALTAMIISLLVLFIPKTHARVILPALPFDDSYPHVISVYDFGENTSIRYVYVTYCKNENYILRSRGSDVEFGNCYDSNGNNQGYAYRRRISYADTDITWQDIINYDIDLSGKEWGSEQYDFSYSTSLGWNSIENRLSYYADYQSQLTPQGNLITLLTGNTNLYNSNGNTLLFDKSLFEEEEEPYCTKIKPLGMFENPKEFSVNINGISNALKEHIQGIVEFTYEATDIINTNQWEITEEITEFTTGYYDFICSTEQQKCELWFDYNYEDDIDEEINLNFKFKTINGIDMPTFIRLYSCLKNYNSIDITYNIIKNTNTGQTKTENKLDNIVGGIGSILNFLNPTNLIYIIVPTEKQMQSLLNEMQESINNKLGILGLPLTIYTRLMNLANTSTQENWCLSWNGVKVPNFENFEIISAGNWCFSEILENQQINTFRNVCINIIGGLILLAFIQYLHNTYNKIIDAPDRDEYEYITTEDVYTVNNETGELTNHVWKKRRTVREKVDK